MNEYVYCANNPITFIDPDGDIPIVLVAMVAWNMYNIYSTAKDAKSFAKKPTLGGGIMVVAGVTPVGKVRTAGKVAKSAKYILDEKAAKHIIARHSARSEAVASKFPKYWSDKKILNATVKIANSAKSKVVKDKKHINRLNIIGKYKGVKIKVVTQGRRIITAFPLKKR